MMAHERTGLLHRQLRYNGPKEAVQSSQGNERIWRTGPLFGISLRSHTQGPGGDGGRLNGADRS